jgi:hypothetical protein
VFSVLHSNQANHLEAPITSGGGAEVRIIASSLEKSGRGVVVLVAEGISLAGRAERCHCPSGGGAGVGGGGDYA